VAGDSKQLSSPYQSPIKAMKSERIPQRSREVEG